MTTPTLTATRVTSPMPCLSRFAHDLEVTDEARRLKLRKNILVLAKEGVRDFQTLRDYAARRRITRFSVIDPS